MLYLFRDARWKRLSEMKKEIICYLTISVSIVLHLCYNDLVACKLIIATMMIAACWMLATMLRENRASKWMSAYHFTFYLYSWPFQAVTMVICERISVPWQMMSLCMFLAGLTGPTVMILAYEKCKAIHGDFIDLALGMRRMKGDK